MSRVVDHARRVRAKNAGPFRLTIDLFCDDERGYEALVRGLSAERVARAFATRAEHVRRFELPELGVLKFSLPRPVVQGAPQDRDMHGAQWAVLVAGLELA